MVLSYLLIWSRSRKKKIHTYPVYCKLTLMRVCQTVLCWIHTESGENTSVLLHLCGWGSAFCQSCKPAIRPEDATEKKNLVYLVYHVSSWRPGSREVVQGSQPSSVRQIEAVPKWQFGPLFFFDSFEFNRNNGTVFFNDCKPFFVQYVSTTCFCSVVWKRPQTATCSRHCYLQMLWCCLCELDFFATGLEAAKAAQSSCEFAPQSSLNLRPRRWAHFPAFKTRMTLDAAGQELMRLSPAKTWLLRCCTEQMVHEVEFGDGQWFWAQHINATLIC